MLLHLYYKAFFALKRNYNCHHDEFCANVVLVVYEKNKQAFGLYFSKNFS